MRQFADPQMWDERAAWTLPVASLPEGVEYQPLNSIIITADGAMIDQVYPSRGGNGLAIPSGPAGSLYAAGRT